MNETTDPKRFAWESMGTHWQVTIWDAIGDEDLEALRATIIKKSDAFDQTYSRFIGDSLVTRLSTQTGRQSVPEDLVSMLRLYGQLNRLSRGKCNPLVGFALSDLGYDAQYSLQEKKTLRRVPEFGKTVTIIDDRTIELHEPVMIDVGAAGKGYFVDRIADVLDAQGLKHFLVDGSGDIRYRGNGHPIRAGLEHPDDPTKVIGTIELSDGAFCASAVNRRKWGTHHHILDPDSLCSPGTIIAAWVIAESAALADGLSTTMFLCDPEELRKELQFEYCLLNDEYKIRRSEGFVAELF